MRTSRLGLAALVSVLAVLLAPVHSAGMGFYFPHLETKTFRQEATEAAMVLYGTVANPQRAPGQDPLGEQGTTDFHIVRVLKAHPWLGGNKIITLPRYLAAAAQTKPPHFLLFCSVSKGKLDPHRAVPANSEALADYLQGALAVKADDRTKALLYFFDYLEHRDPEIGGDAEREFARAGDRDLSRVAPRLNAGRLRGLVADKQMPPHRLGLYSCLLGGCGGERDAELLRALLDNPSWRTRSALGGILAGFLLLRPQEGWDRALAMARDPAAKFSDLYAALVAVRYFHVCKPDASRRVMLEFYSALVARPLMADIAIEDLRKRKWWDLTPDVLACFGKKDYDFPMMRRAVVRFALCCPGPDARRLVEAARRQDAELVSEVEEGLQYE